MDAFVEILLGLTLAGIVVLLVWRRHLKKKKDNMRKESLSNDECASAVDLTLFPEVKDNSEESLLIHCPALAIVTGGFLISIYSNRKRNTCPRCGHSIYLIRPLQQETVIKVIPTDQRKPESTRETTGCLSSFFGYVSLVVGAVLFNFIGYFIVLVILTLCGVFSFGEAVFLLLVGIVLAFLFWPLVASFALLNFLD